MYGYQLGNPVPPIAPKIDYHFQDWQGLQVQGWSPPCTHLLGALSRQRALHRLLTHSLGPSSFVTVWKVISTCSSMGGIPTLHGPCAQVLTPRAPNRDPISRVYS